MNFTNTDCVNKKNSMNFPKSMNFPYIGGGISTSLEKWQVDEQVYWKVFGHIHLIEFKIRREINK